VKEITQLIHARDIMNQHKQARYHIYELLVLFYFNFHINMAIFIHKRTHAVKETGGESQGQRHKRHLTKDGGCDNLCLESVLGSISQWTQSL
jgi:hypothetical protein